MTTRDVLDENKAVVAAFYELAVNQRKPAEAAQKYIGEEYRQHNPEVADGVEPFVQFISGMQKKHPALTVAISHTLAEGDLVALHVHLMREANDPGQAIMELFRLKRGKIVEHWDVVQPVPATTISGNSMF
jgi:predicted SnoaL-like aldol condensation-catalyzing enzyme